MTALVTDIINSFVTQELVPKIVEEVLILSKSGKTSTEIIKEICSKNFELTLNVTTTTTQQHKRASKSTSSVDVSPVSLEEYMENYKDKNVCLYIFVRGEPKGKVCCRTLADGTFTESDDKTYRCEKHKHSSPGPDIRTEISKLKSSLSSTDRAKTIKTTLPKGTPDVFKAKTTVTPKSTGLSSIKDRIQAKIQDHSVTVSKKDDVTTCAAPPIDKDDSCSENEDKDQSCSVRSRSTSKSQLSTPTTDKMMSLDKFEESIPVNSEGEHYHLNPINNQSANEYIWLLVSKNEAMVFDKSFIKCYGTLTQSEPINPDRSFRVSSVWKKVLNKPSDIQMKYIENLNATYETF